MEPIRIEEVTLHMPRHHLSVHEVRRIAASYVENCTRVHPKYTPQTHFVIAIFSDDADGMGVGNSIAMNLPSYLTFEVHALYAKNLLALDDKLDGVSPREAIEVADIIIEIGTVNPGLELVKLKNNRLHVKVRYTEDLLDGNV